MYAFQQVILPIATEFNPDLVIGMYCRFLCFFTILFHGEVMEIDSGI